jgi:ribonuclease G
MKREILISAVNRETRVAILEDDQLVELLVDRPDVKRLVGDIFVGRVDAVLPGIRAALSTSARRRARSCASDLVYDEEVDDKTTTMMTTKTGA